MRHDSVTLVVSERVPLNSIPALHYSNQSEVELESLVWPNCVFFGARDKGSAFKFFGS